MKTGISSLIFTRMKNDVDIVPFLKAASDLGIKYIEYSDTNYPSLNECDDTKLRKVKDIAEDHGINIISVHIPPSHDMGSLDKYQRINALQNIKRNILNASAMGAEYAVLHLPYIEDKAVSGHDTIKNCFLESLSEMLAEAKMRQIMVLLENTIGTWCGNIDTIGNIVRNSGQNIGLCLDIGHCLIEKYDPANAISENIDILKYMHVHDNNGSRDLHLLPGEGIAPWEKILDVLRKIRYDGIFMFESVASSSSEDPHEILNKIKTTDIWTQAKTLSGLR